LVKPISRTTVCYVFASIFNCPREVQTPKRPITCKFPPTMSQPLLPSSAAPSADDGERPSPVMNLNRKTAKGLQSVIRSLYPGHGSGKNSAWTDKDYSTCLKKLLSSATATWTMCLISPKSVLSDKKAQSDTSLGMVEVKAFIAYVDTKNDNQVIFKLTNDTIHALITFYQRHFSVNMAPSSQNFLRRLTQAANTFIHIANAAVLENLDVTGGGTFTASEAEIVEKEINELFHQISVIPTSYHTETKYGPIAPLWLAGILHCQDASQPNSLPLRNEHLVCGPYAALPYPSVLAESTNVSPPYDGYAHSARSFGA